MELNFLTHVKNIKLQEGGGVPFPLMELDNYRSPTKYFSSEGLVLILLGCNYVVFNLRSTVSKTLE